MIDQYQEREKIRAVYQFLLSPECQADGDLQKKLALIRWLEEKLKTEFRSTEDFHQKVRNFLEGKGKNPGVRLKKARKRLKINQFELASILNCSQQLVSAMEKGERVLTEKAIKFIELAENGHSKAQISTILSEL